MLPSWPPSDFDWDAALKQRKLKVVRIEEWEQLDDVDEHGFTKVYPISNFPGTSSVCLDSSKPPVILAIYHSNILIMTDGRRIVSYDNRFIKSIYTT